MNEIDQAESLRLDKAIRTVRGNRATMNVSELEAAAMIDQRGETTRTASL